MLTCVDPSIRVNITIHNTRCTSHTHRQQEYISHSSRQNNPTLPIFRRTGTLITLCSIGFGRHFIRIVAGHHFYFLRLLNQSTRINVTKVEPCISPQVRCPLPPAPGCVTLNTSFNTVSPPRISDKIEGALFRGSHVPHLFVLAPASAAVKILEWVKL